MIKVFLVMMCVCLPIKGVAMSMFSDNEQEVVLFSPIEGVITFKGQPASGAKIVRWIKWKDEEGTKDSVLLGADGRFHFPVKEAVIKLSPVSKFVVNQRLTVFFGDEEYVIWAMGNGKATLYGELGGEPVGLKCELTDKRARVEVEDGLLMTSCVWDDIKIRE